MKIQKVLDEFVNKCSKKLNLYSIIQFGSSTYSKNFDDIDLAFFSKEAIISVKEDLNLIKIIKKFESEHADIVFDFGSTGTRKKKAKYSISIILISKNLLNVKHNPHDLFFLNNLSKEPNFKILYGNNLLANKKFILTKQHLFEMLSVDNKHALRRSLDDLDYRNDAIYFLFKTYLRAMLINESHYKKDELLKKFKEKYKKEIDLPKNSKNILNKKFKKEDFKDILKFSENCLKYLIK